MFQPAFILLGPFPTEERNLPYDPRHKLGRPTRTTHLLLVVNNNNNINNNRTCIEKRHNMSSWSSSSSSSRRRRLVLAFCTASLGGMLLQLSKMSLTSSPQAFQSVALSTTILASNNNNALQQQQDDTSSQIHNKPIKTTIAYTVALTDCPADPSQRYKMYDAAAVLQHSIHRASMQSRHFDYTMIAFVHVNATDCAAILRDKLGFEILVRDTPIDVNTIVNRQYAADLVRSGCCAERELLKLYAYTLTDYPVVVQVDFDFFVLRPLDDLFRAFLDPTGSVSASFQQQHAMYPHTARHGNLQVMFTRQYGLHAPGKARVDFYYMQGGFLMVRPNVTAFAELLQIVQQGNFDRGWYDNRTTPVVQYPKSFGGETVQGLIPFYYGQFAAHAQALELHWCRHNTIIGANTNSHGACLSTAGSFNGTTCIPNCRLTNYSEIYSAHFTDDCVKLVGA